MSEQHKCEGKTRYGWGFSRCSFNGKHFEAGKWWCGVHVPSEVKARSEKSDAKYEAEMEARIRARARQAMFPRLVEALQKLSWINCCCPVCGTNRLHASDCWLSALLDEAEPLAEKVN